MTICVKRIVMNTSAVGTFCSSGPRLFATLLFVIPPLSISETKNVPQDIKFKYNSNEFLIIILSPVSVCLFVTPKPVRVSGGS